MLTTDNHPSPHAYVEMLQEYTCRNRTAYQRTLTQQHYDVQHFASDHTKRSAYLLDAHLAIDDIAARVDVLTKVPGHSAFGRHSYEPTLIVGTYKVTKEQTLALAFSGYVLGQIQIRRGNTSPLTCTSLAKHLYEKRLPNGSRGSSNARRRAQTAETQEAISRELKDGVATWRDGLKTGLL